MARKPKEDAELISCLLEEERARIEHLLGRVFMWAPGEADLARARLGRIKVEIARRTNQG